MDLCFLFGCGSAPVLLFRCFLLAKRKNLAGRFACRRCCHVLLIVLVSSMICLVCEAKVFHVFFFAHFSTASLHCTTVRGEPPEVVRNYNALNRLHTRVGVRRRLEWGGGAG